jgi:hypothetical protein
MQWASKPNPLYAVAKSAKQLACAMAQTAKDKLGKRTASPISMRYHFDPSRMNHSESNQKEERNMLRDVAKRLPRDKWKDLARELGLSETVIEELEQDYSQTGLREVKLKMLLAWKSTQLMEETTIDKLIFCLIKVDLMNIADEIAKSSVQKRLQQCRHVQ